MSAQTALEVVGLILETAIGGLLVAIVIALVKVRDHLWTWADVDEEEFGRIRGELDRIESRIDSHGEDLDVLMDRTARKETDDE